MSETEIKRILEELLAGLRGIERRLTGIERAVGKGDAGEGAPASEARERIGGPPARTTDRNVGPTQEESDRNVGPTQEESDRNVGPTREESDRNVGPTREESDRNVGPTSEAPDRIGGPPAIIPPPLPIETGTATPEPAKPPLKTKPPLAPPSPPPPPKEVIPWEKRMGIWLSRIGVVLVFFAAAFFLKLAMDMMGPLGKAMVGIVLGVVFLGAGEIMERRNYSPIARALTGGGLAILYLAIFASFGYFKPPLIGTVPAFFLMILVTAAGVTLSVRYDSQVVMILALIGGFLTPIMVSTGTDRQVALMSYMLVLDSALIGVAYWKRWRGITMLCFAGTLILFLGWAGRFYGIEKFALTFGFATAFFLVFGVADIIHCLAQKTEAKKEDLVLISLNAAVYFGGMYILINEAHREGMFGIFALGLALFYFGQVRFTLAYIPDDRKVQSFLTGFAVVFLTLAIPLQLDYESVTVVWALEAIALTGYGLYSGNQLLRRSGLLVLVVAIGHLFFQDFDIYERHLRQHEVFKLILAVNVTFWSALLSLAGAIYFYRRFRERVLFPEKLFVGAYVFELVLFMIYMLVFNHYSFESGFYIKFLYSSASRGEALNVSLILGLYSSALVAVGILYRLKWMRYFGLPVLGFTLLKVVFYDLSELPLAFRMVSFMALGGLLIGLSFLYNKYKDRIEGMGLPEYDKKPEGPK